MSFVSCNNFLFLLSFELVNNRYRCINQQSKTVCGQVGDTYFKVHFFPLKMIFGSLFHRLMPHHKFYKQLMSNDQVVNRPNMPQ